MEEYKQLYELYQSKTDSELENIINSNEYTPIAIKVASDILKYGRIGYEETITQQGGTIVLPEENLNKQKESLNLIPSSITSKILLALLIPVCVILMVVFCNLLDPIKPNTSSTIEITQQQSKTEPLTQHQKTTNVSTTQTQRTTNVPAPTVEHRTGENIVGISDKNLSGIRFAVNKVQNDVTGNWKISTINEDIDIEYYAAAYAKLYIHNKSQVHAIVNFTRNTTTSIKKDGNIIYVDIYDYVNGEEFDADLLFTGTLLQQYFVYVDNGDIEKIYVESNENNITETEHDMTDTTSANENNIEETEPNITATTSANVFTYVLNTSTKKFHIPRCSEVKKIKATNYSEYTGTYDEVTSMGYVACKKCRPH